MDRQLVGTDCRTLPLGCLHHPPGALDVVERPGEPHRPHGDELGGCHRVFAGGRLFLQYLFLPELYHPQQFAGEEPAGGRLSVCEQDELWPACAPDTAPCPLVPAHPALGRKELHRVAAVGIQACDTATCGAERHCGVQLSCRRHHRHIPGLPGRRLLYDVLCLWPTADAAERWHRQPGQPVAPGALPHL